MSPLRQVERVAMFRAFLFPGRVRPLEDLVGVGRKVHLHGYLCQRNSAMWFEHGQRLSISTKCLPRDFVGSGHTVREMVVCHRAVVFVGFQGSRAMGTAVSVRFSPVVSCIMLDVVCHRHGAAQGTTG